MYLPVLFTNAMYKTIKLGGFPIPIFAPMIVGYLMIVTFGNRMKTHANEVNLTLPRNG